MAASSSPYVTLISNDGFEFIISRDAACVAGTIKKMLDPNSMCPHAPLRLCFHGHSTQPRLHQNIYNQSDTDDIYDDRSLRRGNFRPMHTWHDKVRPRPSLSALAFAALSSVIFSSCTRRLAYASCEQRRRARKGLRVSVLQSEA